jgi:hypothetical protein
MNRLHRAFLLTTWFLSLFALLSGVCFYFSFTTNLFYSSVTTEVGQAYTSDLQNDFQLLGEKHDEQLPVEQEQKEENEESREQSESKEKEIGCFFSCSVFIHKELLNRQQAFIAHAYNAVSVPGQPLYVKFHQWKDDVFC